MKKILAFEATKNCHGEEEAKKALEKAQQIFENSNNDMLDCVDYKVQSAETKLSTLLKDLGLSASLGEARRLIQGNGVKINDNKSDDCIINDLGKFKLSIGKKKSIMVNIVK